LISDSVNITPIVNDTTPNDNSKNNSIAVVGPYDPNYKEVNIDTIYSVSDPGWLEYTIHFQNIGNDTAFTVIIIDTLSQHLNRSSLEIIASTHPLSNFNIKNGNVAEFRFNNIMLPDSTTDPIGSNGFVKYRMKYLNTLVVNESIINFADIYFDYNTPVRTNSAITYYVDSTSGIEKYDDNEVMIYPNPASEIMYIIFNKTDASPAYIRIFNAKGKLLQQHMLIQAIGNISSSIQLVGLSSGIYFIEIFDGNLTHHKKIVKQ
jgi:hypothetical protein